MPAYQLQEIFTRIGLALAAGILIALPPILWRKSRYETRLFVRITCLTLALCSLLGFFWYAWFLWQRFVPREPAPPEPVTYPVDPGTTTLP